MKGLIGSQNTDGGFDANYIKSSELSSTFSSIPSVIADLTENDDVKQTIWATIIALALLETRFNDRESEWMLIAKKAKSYLKKKKITDLKELLAIAATLI